MMMMNNQNDAKIPSSLPPAPATATEPPVALPPPPPPTETATTTLTVPKDKVFLKTEEEVEEEASASTKKMPASSPQTAGGSSATQPEPSLPTTSTTGTTTTLTAPEDTLLLKVKASATTKKMSSLPLKVAAGATARSVLFEPLPTMEKQQAAKKYYDLLVEASKPNTSPKLLEERTTPMVLDTCGGIVANWKLLPEIVVDNIIDYFGNPMNRAQRKSINSYCMRQLLNIERKLLIKLYLKACRGDPCYETEQEEDDYSDDDDFDEEDFEEENARNTGTTEVYDDETTRKIMNKKLLCQFYIWWRNKIINKINDNLKPVEAKRSLHEIAIDTLALERGITRDDCSSDEDYNRQVNSEAYNNYKRGRTIDGGDLDYSCWDMKDFIKEGFLKFIILLPRSKKYGYNSYQVDFTPQILVNAIVQSITTSTKPRPDYDIRRIYHSHYDEDITASAIEAATVIVDIAEYDDDDDYISNFPFHLIIPTFRTRYLLKCAIQVLHDEMEEYQTRLYNNGYSFLKPFDVAQLVARDEVIRPKTKQQFEEFLAQDDYEEVSVVATPLQRDYYPLNLTNYPFNRYLRHSIIGFSNLEFSKWKERTQVDLRTIDYKIVWWLSFRSMQYELKADDRSWQSYWQRQIEDS